MRALLLDVGGRDNLSGEVQPFTEVVKTLAIVRIVFSFLCDKGETNLGGEGVVVVLPRELGLDVAAGVERLAGLDHVEVLGVNVAVLGKVEVLLGHEHTLCSRNLVSELISHRRISSRKKWKKSGRGWRRRHTSEEVLVDLLAVVLGDKP